MDSEIIPLGDSEKPWTAAGVIATVVNVCHATDFSIPPSWKAIIGHHAKLLLEEGWPGDLVSAAAYMAVLRGRPQIVQHIAGDLILAEKGLRMDRSEYEQKLAMFAADRNGRTAMLAEHEQRRAKRLEEIERRRNGDG